MVARAIEVTVYHCRFCGMPVKQRGRHEPLCKKNPANLKKKERKERDWREGKHPMSVNMLDLDMIKIEKLVNEGKFQSKSKFIRNVLHFVLSRPDLIEAIKNEE